MALGSLKQPQAVSGSLDILQLPQVYDLGGRNIVDSLQ